MEQRVTWKSSGKIVFFLTSLLLLSGLLVVANLVNPVLHFADPNLEKAIRKKINQPTAPLSRLDVLSITELDASGKGIKRLDGIEALRKLAALNLADNAIEDLAPLDQLGMLSELNLTNNQISDLETIHLGRIANLPLRSLSLRDNAIENLAPLTGFRSLQTLNLRGNKIRDVAPLTGLTNLVSLNIHSNPVETGLDGLSALENLQTLILRNVPIGENFRFLGHLKKLQNLNIRNTGMTDLSVIAGLMQAGALQDNAEAGISASINLLETVPAQNGDDPYQSLRPYWDNIAYPYPVNLPYLPGAIKAPVFSQQSGFYTAGFSLTITSENPGAVLYYTLDGAAPALNPQLEPVGSTQAYTGPIFIQNRAEVPNLLSNIITDKWKEHIPSRPVFKGTVVRAMALGAAGSRSDVLTQTYFVDPAMNTRYSLPVVSLVTNADNLFDDELGIYALGNQYQNIYPDEPWRNPANFTQRGPKWERPASFQLFSPQGKILLAQNIGIRINGGFSRAFSPKALRLYAGTQYDQQDAFQYDFFPALNGRLKDEAVSTYKSLVLRNSGTDVRTLFRDALAHSLLEPTLLDIKGSQSVIVFVNGEYWGIHEIRTRYDENYFQTYYGISPDALLVLERSDDIVYLGNYTDETNNFSNLYNLIIGESTQNGLATTSALADEKMYQKISARVDIDNFIQHHISQIYVDNTDWPKTNTLTWAKTSALNNTLYGHDGKLRWMTVDVDVSFSNPEHNNLKRVLTELRTEPSTYLLRSLMENQGFRIRFINQFADQLNTIFREPVVTRKIDEFETIYAPEIEEHIQRWGLPGKSLDSWRENVTVIRKFALLRPGYQRQHILEQFNLPGTVTVTLQTDSSQGSIRINTINIQKGTVGVDDPNHWSGIYFQGVPVAITAVPVPGYRFAGWDETGSKEPNLTLNLTKDITLTAKFVKTD